MKRPKPLAPPNPKLPTYVVDRDRGELRPAPNPDGERWWNWYLDHRGHWARRTRDLVPM